MFNPIENMVSNSLNDSNQQNFNGTLEQYCHSGNSLQRLVELEYSERYQNNIRIEGKQKRRKA